MVFWLLFLIIGICVNIFLAQYKGRSAVLWAILALIFGLISTLVLAVLPQVEETKSCPRCYKDIPLPATRCPYCQADL